MPIGTDDRDAGADDSASTALNRIGRRDVLKASVASGAVGMLAGCLGGANRAASSAGSEESRTGASAHERCPTVEGVKNGFLWTQKVPSGGWGGALVASRSGEAVAEESAWGDGSGDGFRGRANIGQGKLEFDEPGSYEFQYKADPNGLTWVQEPDTLVSIIYPNEPWETDGVVRSDDIHSWSIYPYERHEPLSMSFEIDDPGTYRIAYGPASGLFVFEEWLPNINERDASMRLGVRIVGDEAAYSWVFPEVPQHVWVWGGDDEIVLNRSSHGSEVECTLDEPVP